MGEKRTLIRCSECGFLSDQSATERHLPWCDPQGDLEEVEMVPRDPVGEAFVEVLPGEEKG